MRLTVNRGVSSSSSSSSCFVTVALDGADAAMLSYTGYDCCCLGCRRYVLTCPLRHLQTQQQQHQSDNPRPCTSLLQPLIIPVCSSTELAFNFTRLVTLGVIAFDCHIFGSRQKGKRQVI